MEPTDDDQKPYEERADLEVGQCYVEDIATGKIRFTKKGISEYSARFAKAGININNIQTMAQLKAAWTRSEWVVLDDLRKMVAGHPEFEKALSNILN